MHRPRLAASVVAALLVAPLLVAAPCAVRAQGAELGVAAGVAVPVAGYGSRTPGPLVRGAVTLRGPEHRVRWRGELEGVWLLDGTDDLADVSSRNGTLRAVSGVVSVLVGGTQPQGTVYGVLGVGAQVLRVRGSTNPYGTTPGVRAGLGVRRRIGRAALHVEITPHWALTDFGTGRDFGLGAYVPVVVSIGF